MRLTDELRQQPNVENICIKEERAETISGKLFQHQTGVIPTTLPTGITSFADNDRLAEELEKLLARKGINIATGSQLERICLNVKRILDMHTNATKPTNEDMRSIFCDAVGFMHLAKIIVKSEHLPGFDKLIPHLKLLNDGHPLQNTRSPSNDQASNKLFELVLGLAILNMSGIASSVEIDDPKSAQGDNPDVLATINNKVWGFACKVPNGTADMTLFENIVKGIDQIEKSKAEIGIVVINFKNGIPYEEISPILGNDESGDPIIGTYRNWECICQRLCGYSGQRINNMLNHVGFDNVLKAFEGKKALPGVLVVVQAGVEVKLPMIGLSADVVGKPAPTLIGFLNPIIFIDSRFDESIMTILNDLNRGFYTG
jgi:hypothetical protein